MKLTEKNVLISTGILFVIVFSMLKLGNNETLDQLENLSIEIKSSSYELNEGKLRLSFKRPTTPLNSIQITIIDEKNNSISGTFKLEDEYLIFETYIPELNYESTFNVLIEMPTTENVNLEYKIPEHNIIASKEIIGKTV